jgi:hypothetical protein
MEIEWEDPPEIALARQRSPGRYLEWAFALKENPGRWARLPDGPNGERTQLSAANAAQNIRRGTTAGFKPKGHFEAVADEGKVWVRYNPPPEADDQEGGEDAPGEAEQKEKPKRDYDPATVRAWALNNGFNVPARGRIPDNILEAWERSQTRTLRVASRADDGG